MFRAAPRTGCLCARLRGPRPRRGRWTAPLTPAISIMAAPHPFFPRDSTRHGFRPIQRRSSIRQWAHPILVECAIGSTASLPHVDAGETARRRLARPPGERRSNKPRSPNRIPCSPRTRSFVGEHPCGRRLGRTAPALAGLRSTSTGPHNPILDACKCEARSAERLSNCGS